MKILANISDELSDKVYARKQLSTSEIYELIGCVMNGTVVKDENKAPEKTGHWIFKEFDEETGISNSYWCSACNYPMAQVYDDCCAHCGAKMEREGEKNNADNA